MESEEMAARAERRKEGSHLGREDLGALVEVEGEVAGEVEGPREPFP